MISKRKPHGERQAAADNRVAAIEIAALLEQMHRTAPPAAAALLFAVHLRKHCCHRHAADKRLSMLAIGGNDTVVLLKHRNDANRNGLFSIIKVKETPDLLP